MAPWSWSSAQLGDTFENDVTICTYLVSWSNTELLQCPISTGTAIDQIDSKFKHFAGKDCALFNSPLFPDSGLILFRTFSPVASTDPDEERLAPNLTDSLDDSERVSKAIFQSLTAKLVGTYVRQWRDERVEQISMRVVYLDEVNCNKTMRCIYVGKIRNTYTQFLQRVSPTPKTHSQGRQAELQ